jgi:hypothetical protein
MLRIHNKSGDKVTPRSGDVSVSHVLHMDDSGAAGGPFCRDLRKPQRGGEPASDEVAARTAGFSQPELGLVSAAMNTVWRL